MKLEEVLESLDFTEDQKKIFLDPKTEIKDFNEAYHAKWLHRDLAKDDPDIQSQITGKVLGSLETKAKKLFGLTSEEIKDKKLSEVLEIASAKKEGVIQELNLRIQEGGKGGDSEKKLIELQESLKSFKEKFQLKEDEVHSLNARTEEEKKNFDQRLKTMNIDNILTNAKSSLLYKDEFSEIEKLGFENYLKNSFNYDIDEKNNVIILDKNGNRLENEKKTGHISLKEHLESEALKNNLLKRNNVNEKRRTAFSDESNIDGRKLPKHAIDHAGRLNLNSQ